MRTNEMAAVAFILLYPSTVSAENMAGYGLTTCSDIVATIVSNQNMTLEIMQWAFGYISGLNTASVYTNGTYRDIGMLVTDEGAGGFTVPLLRECKNTPNALFADAVGQIYAQLPLVRFD